MSKLFNEKMCAAIEGDFVVFLIGMRINKPWKIHKWWPVAAAMPRMMKELEANPDFGMLGCMMTTKMIVQYWRSFEHLEAYARNKDSEHLPAWKAFNRSIGKSRGDVGIWHETFLVRAGEYETVYSGMPRMGLALAGEHLQALSGRESARGRLASAMKQSSG